MISHQIQNINKEIHFFLKSQIKSLELKTTITKVKNLLDGLKNKSELAEGRTSKLQDQ